MSSNSEIQGYNMYSMLHFHRKFSSSVTASLNSWLENGGYSMPFAWGSSLRNLVLTSLFSAKL